MLFGLTPIDAGTVVGVTVAFPLVAAWAAYLPARRATAWTRSSHYAASEIGCHPERGSAPAHVRTLNGLTIVFRGGVPGL
jgi:hypothetical protein